MKSRPHTAAQKKRMARLKARVRYGDHPKLGIPPKGKGWVGKKAVDK